MKHITNILSSISNAKNKLFTEIIVMTHGLSKSMILAKFISKELISKT
jgi:hypothetical protein